MAIPKVFKKIDQWGTQQNKFPHTVHGEIQHLTYEQAKKQCEKLGHDGLYFNFKGTAYFYIDLDSYKKGADKKYHKKLIKKASKFTYVEKSQSGKGHHIILEGDGKEFKSDGDGGIDVRSNNILFITGDEV